MAYTKLFSSIVASTIWREDDKTRLVWITMLAMKNERHIVEASLPGLADLARVSIKECEAAIAKLEGPDKWSRNQGHGGRRIEKVDGGWMILNGEYYRHQMSLEDKREYQKLYHREYRKKNRPLKQSGSGLLVGEAAHINGRGVEDLDGELKDVKMAKAGFDPLT
jgi:hypothetical protein